MSKHTPGPFRFTPFVGGDGRTGYAILSDNPEVGRGYGVMWVEEGEFPNAKHDGPLFAAAPDLLSALVTYHNAAMAGRDPDKTMMDRAAAALAKAEA
ncbi:hypothetical protein [Azospirillum sp.]|uniref:hypothetical protein n=1 Tax=Azospirillum sp. TaxID=34012 RepID=UPI002D555F92|nr:hypothetical protein [Azospirillum sp.]HYF89010.1 hypothetical protein [Azospirillum sp.]